MSYVYEFVKAKKIDEKTTRMATVIVYNIETKKEIGRHSWGSLPKHTREATINDMIYELIREHETRKVWNAT